MASGGSSAWTAATRRDLSIVEGVAPGRRPGRPARPCRRRAPPGPARPLADVAGRSRRRARPGDYLRWDGTIPHDAEVIGDEEGHVLIVTLRPQATARSPASRRHPNRNHGARAIRVRRAGAILRADPTCPRGSNPSAARYRAQVKVVPMKVGVAKETAPGERRVALVPEALGKLKAAGLDILVERGAGAGSSIPDAAYEAAGATIVSTDDLYRDADAILRVAKPSDDGGRQAAQGPGAARPAGPAHRSEDRQVAGRPRRDRDQPRRDPAHAVARADDGRPLVAGQRRWLQGGPDRGQRLRPLLPAADDRGRDGQAGQRPDPRHRRGRAPGDRHGAPPRRGGQGLRRPARDARAGREPGRPVRQAQDDDRCDRCRRLRPRADRRGAGGPAGRAQRGHRRDGHRHHHRPGPGPQAAAPRHGRGGRQDEVGLGHRRHGGLGAGRQRRAVEGRARRSSRPTA